MNLSPRVALLVDDEAYFRRFVGQLLLKKHGFEQVIEARDGKEAMELFPIAKPDVVVLDINMPRLDGIDTLQALRTLSATVPIIMLTSISDEMMVERCVEAGATYFIRKDVPAQNLTQELGDLLTEFTKNSPANP